MKKDKEPNRKNFKSKRDAEKIKSADNVAAPDYSLPNTSAPNSTPNPNAAMGYGKDRPVRNKLDESEVAAQRAKGETPGNEVEASLNPDEENLEEDQTDK
ncbi:hypothetical protein SAMN04488102_12214 [Alkalibacterium subtropicum]|uniref:Uncharacterized protein n=1 Tax=Alkalibacterium subtropicum TaxID=753702 RepID=A0A1I1LJ61_9LACT|nr:hypothetical protein [Alkalibacterium subtropicum]SFC72602.1 hypothetical protein SAMN04488102_12214 [Alkalibacterium subtropicum]